MPEPAFSGTKVPCQEPAESPPIVNELQGDRVVLLLERGDHRLQLIAALRHHADGVSLNLRPCLRVRLANELADLLRQLDDTSRCFLPFFAGPRSPAPVLVALRLLHDYEGGDFAIAR